jgi:predicted PurR-regulated permease PerM
LSRDPSDATSDHAFNYRDLQRGILLAAGIYLLVHYAETLTPLLLFFLLVFILTAVVNPPVVWLEKRGIPRIAGALGIVFGLVGLLALLGWLAVPPLLDEVSRFVGSLDEKQATLTKFYDDTMRRYPELKGQVPDPATVFKNMGPWLTRALGMVGHYASNVAAGLVSVVLLLVLVIFSASQPAPLVAGLLATVPDRHRPRTQNAVRRILEQLKNWAGGSLILGVIVGLVCGIGLKAMGVPYALLFGVIAGIGELIPNIGPVLSAVPPIAIALLTGDPVLAGKVAVLFVVVQQLENSLLVPFIMGQSLNLHPVSVVSAVLIMGTLFGLFGAVLAVPVCAIIKVLWQELYLAPQEVDLPAVEKAAQELVGGPAEVPLRRKPKLPNRRRVTEPGE